MHLTHLSDFKDTEGTLVILNSLNLASAEDAHAFGGLRGTARWEETPGWTQNLLEGLYISTGLGTARDPSGGILIQDVWKPLLSPWPLQSDLRKVDDNGWVDNYIKICSIFRKRCRIYDTL